MGEGAELDKIPPKFRILKFFPDVRRKSPCLIIAAPKQVAAAVAGQYGGGIIIAPEYTPAANWTEQCQNGTLLKKFSSVRRLKGAFSA